MGCITAEVYAKWLKPTDKAAADSLAADAWARRPRSWYQKRRSWYQQPANPSEEWRKP
jgi:hypothetical protein